MALFFNDNFFLVKKHVHLVFLQIHISTILIDTEIVIIALLFFFLIKKNKIHINEEVETLDETQSTTNTNNPIYNKNADDDPFKDEFNTI